DPVTSGRRSTTLAAPAGSCMPQKYIAAPPAMAPTAVQPHAHQAARASRSAIQLKKTSGTTKNSVASPKPQIAAPTFVATPRALPPALSCVMSHRSDDNRDRVALVAAGPDLHGGKLSLQAFGKVLDATALGGVMTGQDDSEILDLRAQIIVKP